MNERSAADRRADLVAFYHELRDCRKCPLWEGRTQVVFGSGSPNADLMFVGEAPGFNEDRQGKPFVGRAGNLLDTLLDEIGLVRKDVFITNVLMCRPPDNRDPQPLEIERCEPHLMRKVELIEPRVICTLGNFATKLLTGRSTGITRVRGTPQTHTLAGRPVRIYPIYHPAAALRTQAMLDTLREDFARLPALLGEELPAVAEPEPALATAIEEEEREQEQLGLFA